MLVNPTTINASCVRSGRHPGPKGRQGRLRRGCLSVSNARDTAAKRSGGRVEVVMPAEEPCKAINTQAVTEPTDKWSLSLHLPITKKEIVDGTIAAAEAYAAIPHQHARSTDDGRCCSRIWSPDRQPRCRAAISWYPLLPVMQGYRSNRPILAQCD